MEGITLYLILAGLFLLLSLCSILYFSLSSKSKIEKAKVVSLEGHIQKIETESDEVNDKMQLREKELEELRRDLAVQ